MTTGILDITSFRNAIGYGFNGSHTLPYTTYYTLLIEGTGTKTISGNTTLNGGLGIGSGTLELSTFNLIVNGETSQYLGTFSKNGSGNILFVGKYTIQDMSGAVVNFTGNPTIEFRNGFNIGNNYHTFDFGTGLISFTTNNQEFRSTSALTYTFNNNVLISGAITLTWNLVAQGNPLLLNGSINGDNANSKLLMNTNGIIVYRNATQPMATGILDTSTNANTWIYGNANQDIKGGPTTGAKQVYRNLTLNGGGTKTLQGYVSVLNTYTLTSPATLANNGFTLTNP
jgi:filamentous hemagglutinin family protein